MTPTNTMILTAITVMAGKWAQGKELTPKFAVGIAFAAIGLTALDNWNSKIAQQLGAVILVSAVLINGPSFFKALDKVIK